MKVIKLFTIAVTAVALTSCGSGNKEKAAEAEAANETFQAEQPVKSGVYDAEYFDIQGKDSRKGQFDGRVIYALSPEQSVVYVYENGNRTKIKHLLMLEKGFVKGDSLWTATDAKGMPVTVVPDSARMKLNYIANSDTVSITFNPEARNLYDPIEALAKIKETAQK